MPILPEPSVPFRLSRTLPDDNVELMTISADLVDKYTSRGLFVEPSGPRLQSQGPAELIDIDAGPNPATPKPVETPPAPTGNFTAAASLKRRRQRRLDWYASATVSDPGTRGSPLALDVAAWDENASDSSFDEDVIDLSVMPAASGGLSPSPDGQTDTCTRPSPDLGTSPPRPE
ncbi:hypothetical protein BGZ61DRAFT_486125 [Ilyonectria robusta]|uniref:uncharacterized protein n=1 Tax=Ilyonectria robusta TaxID=1079257 RepID=UPI001E8D4412|nr:uncharacterized protein BGZ61DRAFT_486125 [Ilyonectria robusta]KAH8658943.1 hypothetical protein BGZ61DRAFT_486125 [Ilyonectria robusta]